MTKNKILKVIDAHFKPRSNYERLWCRQQVLPFAEKLLKVNNDSWIYTLQSYSCSDSIKTQAMDDIIGLKQKYDARNNDKSQVFNKTQSR